MSGSNGVESISQLDSATQANSTDIIPATQGSSGPGSGTTRGVTVSQILNSGIASKLGALETTGQITVDAGGIQSIGPVTLNGTVTVGAGSAKIVGGASNSAAAITGTTTNDSAAAGFVGEFISSNIPVGSSTSLTSATGKNITSISLTAGDWDVWGQVSFTPAAGTIPVSFLVAISTVSASEPTPFTQGCTNFIQTTFVTGGRAALPTGTVRLSLASTTTIYLVAFAGFSVSTLTAFGFIAARRAR